MYLKKGKGITMAKDLDQKFKIEPLNDTTFEYTISRKNFLGSFTVVATAILRPSVNYIINFSKRLKASEEQYVHNYFRDLVNLKIELAPNNKSYHIYRNTTLVAFATLHEHEVFAVDFLSSTECAYISRYFRNKFNNVQSTHN